MNSNTIFLITTAIVNLFMALFILLKGKKDKSSHLFSLFTLSLALWCGSFYLSLVTDQCYLFLKFAFVFSTIMAATFLHFSMTFPENKRPNILTLLIIYLPVLIFFVGIENILEASYRLPMGYKNVYGILYKPYLLYELIFFCGGFVHLIRKYFKYKGIERLQIKYILLGTIASWGFICFSNIILPVMGNSTFASVGPIATIVFVSFTTYAILKHRLMDIEIIIKKSIVYSILVGIISCIYILLATLFGELIQNLTDSIFFRRKNDYKRSLNQLSRELSSIIDLKQLQKMIVLGISKTIRINSSSILLISDKDHWCGYKNEYITNYFQISDIKMTLNKKLVDELIKNNDLLFKNEIDDEEIKEAMKSIGATICIPLIGKKGLFGILNLDKKLSEATFSTEDFELLSTIASHAATAIENAMLIEKEKEMIKKIELSERLALFGKFASGLVHEIRNPLVSIKAFFQVFNDSDESDEDKQELSGYAFQEIVRVEGLLENLLRFANPPKPDLVKTDVSKLLDEIIYQLNPEMNLRRITCSRNNTDHIVTNIMADSKQIKQVFLNVFLNSIQSVPENNGIITVKITPCVSTKSLTITIHDNGYGIPQENLGRIFEPFYSTKSDGTGLGLAVSFNIVKDHGGEIKAYSEAGKGTTISIRLPIDPPLSEDLVV